MRKLLTRLLVFLLAVTSVFGLTGLKSVKAEDSAIKGFEIKGASVRNNNADESDLTGIRFTTIVSQEAYDAIIAEANGAEVKFGTEITDNDVGHKIQDFCYVSTVEGGEGIVQVAKGAFQYYASITFNDVDFAKDVLKRIRGLKETDNVDLETATEEESAKISAYKSLAYAEVLKATSYYEIAGVKYYTKSLARSMRMVANYYDKNPEEFGKLPEEFYAKNYFVKGVERFGYLKENGEVVVDGVKVDAITGVSYKAQPIEFEVVDGALKVEDTAFVEEELSETLALYAFDKDNRVTVLNLKYVTETISTAEDFSKLDVDYTFNQDDYKKLTSDEDKESYLAKRQAEPFKYYEGYYVLTNDIDCSKYAFQHNVTTAVAESHTKVGFLFNDAINQYVTEFNGRLPNDNAHDYDGDGNITELEKKYYVPRYGYPLLAVNGEDGAKSRILTVSYYHKVGFRGTFDGQGYILKGVNVKNRSAVQYYADYSKTVNNVTTNYTNSLTAEYTFNAGLFGVTCGGCVIKNVALVDGRLDWGSYFASTDISVNLVMTPDYEAGVLPIGRQADIYDAIVTVPGRKIDSNNYRTIYENIYIKNKQQSGESVRGWGVLFRYTLGYTLPDYRNVILDFVNVGSSNASKGEHSGLLSGFMGGSAAKHTDGNSGFRAEYKNVYLAIANYGNPNNSAYGFEEYHDITINYNIDALYEATTNTYGTEKTMAGSFADNPYFTVVGKKVYWKGVYEKSLALSETSVELAKGKTKEITLSIGGETVTPEKVEYDDNVLKYEGTTLSINNYVAGTYEVVFTYNGAKTVLTVTLPAIVKNAYLQEDGELVSHGLNSIVGKYFTVNGTEVDATMFNGKIKLDISSLGFAPLNRAKGTATVEMYGDYGKEITFNCDYVSLAIDEAEDLTKLSVDYTYNDADYNAATDKAAYLAACQENPFDYFNGYYVLTKNIDATGIELRHEAVIPTDKNATNIGVIANENTNTYEAVHPDAGIPCGDKTYVFPRPGYPLVGIRYVADWSKGTVSEVKGFPFVLFDNIGLTGTFDGQGYSITNLTTTRTTPISYKVSGSADATVLGGSGLFGVIRNKTVIKNVGLFINADNGASGIALCEITPNTPKTWTVSATDNRDLEDAEPFNTAISSSTSTRCLLENVYIEDLGKGDYNTRPYGLIVNGKYTGNYGALAFNNVLINAPKLRMEYGVFNARYFYGTVGSRDPRTTNLFIVALNKGTITTNGNNKYDITYSTTLESLLDGTVNTSLWDNDKNGVGEASSIYDLSDIAPNYWLAIDTNSDGTNDKLYWKEYYNSYAKTTTNAIELNENVQSVEVGLIGLDDKPITSGVEVKVNGDALEYVDGKVQVKNYIAGEYELTFIYKGAEFVVPVTLATQQKTAYLQTNGELVGSNLETIENKSFKVNGTAVDATIVDGKIMLDIAKLALTAPVYTAGTAEVELVGAYGTEIVYNSMYVAVAIDEASDLQQFGVNYTYNQAEFDAMPETTEEEIAAKVAYLEDKLVNPYTYFEGYVVLTKDIDADGITFHHDALYYVANNVDNIGYTINEVGNTLTAKNAKATINFNNKDYDFPRPGYPAFKSSSSSKKANDYVPGAFFYKMGFYGTFDGQGHVIDNLNPVNTADIEYYVGETATKYTGVYAYGAGIFGAVSANNVFKNVALTNYVGKSGPAFALIDITPTSKGTASYNYDENDIFNAMGESNRTVFTNMYIEVVGNDHASGSTVRFTAGNRGSNFDNIIVNALNGGWGNGAYGSGREAGYLGGGYQWSNKNSSLCQQVDNVVIIAPEGQNPAYTDATYTYLDVIFEHSPEAAFSATTNTIGETVATPLERFNSVQYFTVVGNQVYWHSLAPQAE